MKEILFNILYFLVSFDPQFESLRDYFLGMNGIEEDPFTNTLLVSLLGAIGLAVLFYVVLNRLMYLNYMWAWLLTALVMGIIAFNISYYQCGTYVYDPADPIGAAGWKFIGMSTILGILYFYLFSLLFKGFSIYAKKLPHSTKNSKQ